MTTNMAKKSEKESLQEEAKKAGIEFNSKTTIAQLQELIAVKGKEATVPEGTAPEGDVEYVDSYDELTFVELKAEADDRGLEYEGIKTKKALIVILEAEDEKEGTAPGAPKGDDTVLGEGERTKSDKDVTPEEVENKENPDEAVDEDLGRQDASVNDTRHALNKGSSEVPSEDETSVDIVHDNKYIRTYSKEIHGSEYQALAKQFVSKVSGRTILPSGKLKWIKVSYRARSKALGIYYTKDEVFTGKNFKNDALAFASQVRGSCICK